MNRPAGQFQDILLDDIKGRPELITDILFDDDDLSLILEKRGKTVRFAYLRRYDADTTQVLEKARREYAQKAREGYTREEAALDFLEAQEEIHHHIARS